MKDMEFPSVHVYVEKDAGGYYAFCRDFEGCTTRGSTLEQVTGPTMKKVREVLELLGYIRTMAEPDNLIAVEPLIDALDQDPNTCVRREAASSLAAITGEKFGESAVTWRTWWAEYRRR